jgi:hypothetical protein
MRMNIAPQWFTMELLEPGEKGQAGHILVKARCIYIRFRACQHASVHLKSTLPRQLVSLSSALFDTLGDYF